MRTTFLASLAAFTLLLSAPPPAFVASASAFHPFPFKMDNLGGLAGTVVDAAGSPIAHATVRCINLATGAVLTQITNGAGRYEWPRLPAGDYRLEVASPGFSATTLVIKVPTGQTAQSRILLHGGNEIESAVIHHDGLPPHPLLPGNHPPPPVAVPLQPPPPAPQPMPSHDHAHIPDAGDPGIQSHPDQSHPDQSHPDQSHPEHNQAQGGPGIPAAPHQPPNHSTPASDPNADYLSWLQNLPYGQIQDSIDSQMSLNTPITVTVTIGGQGAAPLPSLSGSAPAQLQVSPYMWVDLTDPDNPGGFDIQDIDTPQNPRHVVPGATTTWRWKVTPQQLGAMKLHVDAYIMQGQDVSSRVSYGRYDKSVKVDVSWSEYPVNAFLWVLTNPGKSANWLLPGGGGAAILLGILAWWKKRKNKSAA